MNIYPASLTMPAGTILFSQGDMGDVAYLIRSGKIELFIKHTEREYILGRRGSGEIVGEMALPSGGVRAACARVIADCELVPVTAQQIERRLATVDPLVRVCLKVFVERLRNALMSLAGGETIDASLPRLMQKSESDFEAVLETLTVESELEAALRKSEFELFFQPIVRLADGDLRGFEALIRWNHPARGLILPGQFIQIAEASGVIGQITQWCLREVGRIYPELAAAAPPGMFISVNLSGRDLTEPAFAQTVQAIMSDAGIPAQHLKLEVTESMLIKNPAEAKAILDACGKIGMGITIDKFGTGCLNLKYLNTLPVTHIKIDSGFVQSMLTDMPARRVVNAIRLLSHELNIAVIAEGIEDERQAAALDAIQCELGQGNLYGRPLALPETLKMVRCWPLR